MRKLLVVYMLLICTFLVACEENGNVCNNQDYTSDDIREELVNDLENDTQIDDVDSSESDIEKKFSGELVSVNYFMEYYKIQDTDISVDYNRSIYSRQAID